MARFEAVGQFHHVGVLDTKSSTVMHLGPDSDGYIIIKQESLSAKWTRSDGRYCQLGTDDHARDRWNVVVNLYNSVKDNIDELDRYDEGGDLKNGMNCENIVGYVLENDPTPVLGRLVGLLRKIGVDVSMFRSLGSLSK